MPYLRCKEFIFPQKTDKMPPNILSFVVLSCKMHVSYVSVVVWLWLRLVCACDCIKHAKTTARLCSVYGELSPTEPVECLYAQIVWLCECCHHHADGSPTAWQSFWQIPTPTCGMMATASAAYTSEKGNSYNPLYQQTNNYYAHFKFAFYTEIVTFPVSKPSLCGAQIHPDLWFYHLKRLCFSPIPRAHSLHIRLWHDVNGTIHTRVGNSFIVLQFAQKRISILHVYPPNVVFMFVYIYSIPSHKQWHIHYNSTIIFIIIAGAFSCVIVWFCTFCALVIVYHAYKANHNEKYYDKYIPTDGVCGMCGGRASAAAVLSFRCLHIYVSCIM